MSPTFRFLIRCAIGALFSTAAMGADVATRAAAVADLLIPEVKAWRAYADLPALKPERVASLRAELLRAWRVSPARKMVEADGCNFTEQILPAGKPASNGIFREVDLDADGQPDVIYSGPARCTEGDLTVVWFGTKTGLELRYEFPARWQLLRLQPGREPLASAVARSCCSDPFDEYFHGTAENPRNKLSVKVTKSTQLPRVATPAKPLKAGAFTLRSSPAVDDRYVEGPSNMMEHAVFGNALCKYLAGVDAQVLAEEKDATGRVWWFIRTDRDSGRLRHDAPYPVDAGWMLRDAPASK